MGSEWKTYLLKDLVSMLPGFAFKSPEFIDSGVPVLKIKNIKANEVLLNELAYVAPSVAEKAVKYRVQFGDILVTLSGNRHDGSPETWVGKVAQYRFDAPALLNQRVAKLSPKQSDVVNSRFLTYVLSSVPYQKHFIAIATSSGGQANLSSSQVLSVELDLPPLPTQSKIASILGSLDDKIELNRKTAKTLEEMAQALFRSWFVDFDPVIDNAIAAGNPIPPEFEQRAANRQEARARAEAEGRSFGLPAEQAKLFPDGFEDSEVGPIPIGWTFGQFSDICSNYRNSVSAESINSNEIYIGLEHLPRRSLTLSDWGNGSDVSSQKSRFITGQLLFGKLRPYFHKVSLAPFDGICSTDILVLEPREKELKAQAFLTASSDHMIRYVTGKSDGTRMPRTSWNDLGTFIVPIVPKPISTSFNNLIEPIFEGISRFPFETESLAKIRDSLLPKLISGEIQVA